MKPFLLLTALVAPMLMTSCVVEHDVAYRHPYRPYHRRDVVVERAPVGIVYYNDVHGRYYWGRHHRRVYVNVY